MTKQELVEKVLSVLNLEENKLKELEIEVTFSNGKELDIELEN